MGLSFPRSRIVRGSHLTDQSQITNGLPATYDGHHVQVLLEEILVVFRVTVTNRVAVSNDHIVFVTHFKIHRVRNETQFVRFVM